MLRFWGITDRDNDGKKEVLSIASETGTAATKPIYVSVYETSTGEVRQLKSFRSRFTAFNKFKNAGSSRAWLTARLEEFEGSTGGICIRTLVGQISCEEESDQGATADEPRRADAPESGWMGKNVGAWLASNGLDFVGGKMHLTWVPGRFTSGDRCRAQTGRYEWHNVFKGPLVVNDLSAHQTAVAYLQDGDHHREIPNIIFGRRYVWLALSVNDEILAIDPSTFELKRFAVPEFKNGIPRDPDDLSSSAQAASSSEDSALTKDNQLSGLDVSEGRLTYNGAALTLDVPFDEFAAATQCWKNE